MNFTIEHAVAIIVTVIIVDVMTHCIVVVVV